MRLRIAHPIPPGGLAALGDALVAREFWAALADEVGARGEVVGRRRDVGWEAGFDSVGRIGRKGDAGDGGGEEKGEERELHFGWFVDWRLGR